MPALQAGVATADDRERVATEREPPGKTTSGSRVMKHTLGAVLPKKRKAHEDPGSWDTFPGRVCGGCAKKPDQCVWRSNGLGACEQCVKKKVACDIAVRQRAKRVKAGSADHSPRLPTVDLPQEATATATGSMAIPPHLHAGPQPVHGQRQFPGLMADMAGGFGSMEDDPRAKLLSFIVNSHSQTNSKLRALLPCQEALLVEARLTREALTSIADSLATLTSHVAMRDTRDAPGHSYTAS